jgi:hypothetical protein
MKLYVVRNSQGKFFKPVGFGGYGVNWQDTIEKAKFYTKIGPAKAQCTFWYNNNPKYGCPVILEFDIDPAKAVVLPMIHEAVKKAAAKAKREAKNAADRRAYEAVRNMENASKLIQILTPAQKKELGIL